jgi:hypothetical protein
VGEGPCPACGLPNKPSARFCANCGASMGVAGATGGSATSTKPPPPPTAASPASRDAPSTEPAVRISDEALAAPVAAKSAPLGPPPLHSSTPTSGARGPKAVPVDAAAPRSVAPPLSGGRAGEGPGGRPPTTESLVSITGSSGRSTAALWVAVVVLALVAGGALYLAVKPRESSTQPAPAATGFTSTSWGGGAQNTEPSRAPVTPTASTLPPPEVPPPASTDVHSGRLNSTFATLRTSPTLGEESEITIIRDRNDAPLTVLEGPVSGWYRVSFEDLEGWLWGAFVLPSAPGQLVAETRTKDPVILRSAFGVPLNEENPSGNAVLVTSTDGDLWQVLLPDGRPALVDPREMVVAQ